MRDMIAMLDGLGAAHTSETVTPGDGQNFTGGATWAPGFPTLVSGPYGLAGLSGAQAETVSPGDGQNFTGGATWAPGFPTLVSGPYGLAGYSVETVTPGAGQNFTGGAAWAPGFPTLVSGSYGLAASPANAMPMRGGSSSEAAIAAFGSLPAARVIRAIRSILQQYGRVCSAASSEILNLNRAVERKVAAFSGGTLPEIRGGWGDRDAVERLSVAILDSHYLVLLNVVEFCSGSPVSGSRVGRTTRLTSLETLARLAIAQARVILDRARWRY